MKVENLRDVDQPQKHRKSKINEQLPNEASLYTINKEFKTSCVKHKKAV